MSENTSPPPTRERRNILPVIAIMLSLAAIAAVGLMFEQSRKAPVIKPVPTKPPRELIIQRAQIVSIEDTLATLRDDLTAIQNTIADAPAPTEAFDASSLESRIDALSDELATAQDATAAKLEAIEEANEAARLPEQYINARIAYLLLRDAVRSGLPYTKPLAQLRDAMPALASEKPYDTLESYADKGIASRAQLARELAILAAAQSTDGLPDNAAAAPSTWWQQSLHSLTDLVKVERIEGDSSPLEAFAQAQQFVAYGEVREARDALGRLPASDRARADDWMEKIDQRLEVMAALSALGAIIINAAADTSTSDAESR